MLHDSYYEEEQTHPIIVAMDATDNMPLMLTFGATSSATAQDNCLQCVYCLFKYKPGSMINMGTKDHPRWVDKPCHAAARWYDKALVSKGAVPGDMKKQQPRKYAKHVWRFRVSAPDDPPDVKAQCELQTKQDRRNVAYLFFESEEHEVSTTGSERRIWANRLEFIGYHISFLGHSKEEATQAFTIAQAENSGVARRKNKKGENTWAIDLPYMTTKSNTMKKTRGIREQDTCSDDDEIEDFLGRSRKKMKLLDHEEGLNEIIDVPNPFAPGTAAEPSPRKIEPVQSGVGPLTANNLRQLDAQSVSSRGSKAGSTCASGLNMDVLDNAKASDITTARSTVKKSAKAVKSKLMTNKSSNYQVTIVFMGKLGDAHVEVIALQAKEKVDNHKKLVERLVQLVAVCNSWAADAYQEKVNEIYEVTKLIRESDADLAEVAKILKENHNSAVKEETTGKRSVALKVRTLLKSNPLAPQGCPATIVSWMGSTVLGIKADSESVAPQSDGKIVKLEADAEDWSNPFYWPKTCTGSQVEAIRRGLSSAKYDLNGTSDALASGIRAPRSDPTLMCQLMVKDHQSQESCLPAVFKEGDLAVRDMMSKGAFGPWAMAGTKFSFRGGVFKIPLDSFAQFLYVHAGSLTVVTWSSEKLAARGSALKDLVHLLNGLTPAEAKAACDEMANFQVLEQGCVMYVPYGTVFWMVAHSDAPAVVVSVPLLCDKLYMSTNHETREQIKSHIKFFTDSATVAPGPWQSAAVPLARFMNSQ